MATNVIGEASLTKTDYLNSGGLFLPFYDDFESGSFGSKSYSEGVNTINGEEFYIIKNPAKGWTLKK